VIINLPLFLFHFLNESKIFNNEVGVLALVALMVVAIGLIFLAENNSIFHIKADL
jgi:hypothetical protein